MDITKCDNCKKTIKDNGDEILVAVGGRIVARHSFILCPKERHIEESGNSVEIQGQRSRRKTKPQPKNRDF